MVAAAVFSKKVNYILKYFCQVDSVTVTPPSISLSLSLSLSQFLSLDPEISSHEQTLQRHDTKCHFHFECISFLLFSDSLYVLFLHLAISNSFPQGSAIEAYHDTYSNLCEGSSVETVLRQIIVPWCHVLFWGCDHLYKAGRHMRRCLQTFKRVLSREVLKGDTVQTFTRGIC